MHAIVLGERIDAAKLERSETLSTTPLAFTVGDGFVVVFRYGVIVLVGLSKQEEAEAISLVRPYVVGETNQPEDESVDAIPTAPGKEDEIPPGGPVAIKELSNERLLIVADALAKSVALARYERIIGGVFEELDPLSQSLARDGRVSAGRGQLLKLVGQALLVQQRLSGRIAADEKPDVLWDRPELERLYSRLDDEFELAERGMLLGRKMTILQENAQILTDLIDVQRSARLEITIVLLIAIEIALSLLAYFRKT